MRLIFTVILAAVFGLTVVRGILDVGHGALGNRATEATRGRFEILAGVAGLLLVALLKKAEAIDDKLAVLIALLGDARDDRPGSKPPAKKDPKSSAWSQVPSGPPPRQVADAAFEAAIAEEIGPPKASLR